MIHQRIRKARAIDAATPWHSRGYLPHFDGDVVQFVTYRLADSLPKTFLRTLKWRLDNKQITDVEYYREVESYLDLVQGPAYLGLDTIATLVMENLLRFDDVKYKLLHWVVMPNHVHILIQPNDGISLSSIVHSAKSYTANRANELLNRSGRFWSIESYDRYIRDGRHFGNTVRYIHENPVKAGLCDKPEDWKFSCASRHEC